MSDKTIHNGHRHRLREKFIKHSDSFSDHELLELLLTYAIPRVDTNKTAHKLIDAFGSLQAVISADPKVLTTVDGRFCSMLFKSGRQSVRNDAERRT